MKQWFNNNHIKTTIMNEQLKLKYIIKWAKESIDKFILDLKISTFYAVDNYKK